MSPTDLNTDWMIYGALTAGCVGAVAGLSGLALGRAAIRRDAEARSLDLRLRLGKLESDLRETVAELPRTMQRAERADLTLVASGGIRQGASSGWQREVDDDFATLRTLESAVAGMGVDHTAATAAELERRVLACYQIQSKAQRLQSKYGPMPSASPERLNASRTVAT